MATSYFPPSSQPSQGDAAHTNAGGLHEATDDTRKEPTTSATGTTSPGLRYLRPFLEKCDSQSKAKPEQKMHDIQIAASIYAIIFGLITLGAWTTANGFANQANCLARTSNILNLLSLCATEFGASNMQDVCQSLQASTSPLLRDAIADQLDSLKKIDVTCPIQLDTLSSPITRQAYGVVGGLGGAMGVFGLVFAFRSQLSRFVNWCWRRLHGASLARGMGMGVGTATADVGGDVNVALVDVNRDEGEEMLRRTATVVEDPAGGRFMHSHTV